MKLPSYRQIETVQEILLLDSDGIHAELHRRAGALWITELLRGEHAPLTLESVPITVSFSELYEGVSLPDREP